MRKKLVLCLSSSYYPGEKRFTRIEYSLHKCYTAKFEKVQSLGKICSDGNIGSAIMPLHLWACKAADNCRIWRTQHCHVLCLQGAWRLQPNFNLCQSLVIFLFNMLHLVLCYKLCTKWRQKMCTPYSSLHMYTHTPLITYTGNRWVRRRCLKMYTCDLKQYRLKDYLVPVFCRLSWLITDQLWVVIL